MASVAYRFKNFVSGRRYGLLISLYTCPGGSAPSNSIVKVTSSSRNFDAAMGSR